MKRSALIIRKGEGLHSSKIVEFECGENLKQSLEQELGFELREDWFEENTVLKFSSKDGEFIITVQKD